jgi:hypothetical protein
MTAEPRTVADYDRNLKVVWPFLATVPVVVCAFLGSPRRRADLVKGAQG